MKSFVFAIITFVVIFVCTGLYRGVLTKKMTCIDDEMVDICSCIKNEDWSSGEAKTKAIAKEWDKTQSWLKVVLNHKDVDFITQSINELNSYVETKNKDEAFAKANLIRILVQSIPRNEKTTLINIL